MNGLLRLISRGGPKTAVATVVALGGFATAALVGVAFAGTFTLKVATGATVSDQAGTNTTENIVATRSGRAVYALTGDSARHPKCTKANGCFAFWPPVTVSSHKKLRKAPGVRGKLGTWRRDGFLQVTLAGHPLYRYAGDSQKDSATGQGIQTFGGTWHVIKARAAAGATSTSPVTTPNTMTTTSTTTTTPCVYPPYC